MPFVIGVFLSGWAGTHSPRCTGVFRTRPERPLIIIMHNQYAPRAYALCAPHGEPSGPNAAGGPLVITDTGWLEIVVSVRLSRTLNDQT